MKNLKIITVENKVQFDNFFNLPKQIYAQAPLWVPPLIKDEKKLLTPDKHPYWENAKRQLFLAMRGEQVVGRIAAIIDDNYNAYAKELCGAWGFFECHDDKEAAHALFLATAKWHKQHGMEFMRGPLNPSSNYTCGMLVHGFDLAPSIMMPWNYDYYPQFAESWFMRKEQDLFAYTFQKDNINIPAWISEQIAIIKERSEFSQRTSTKATLAEDIHTMLDIYQDSWAKNWGFTPMPIAEAKQHVHTLKSVLDPEFFVLFYYQGKPAGGMLALPDMNPLLKKLDGKIGISAPWHLWRLQKELRSHYRLLLFGIREEYRLMGLPLLLLDFMLNKLQANPDLTSVEGSWSLEDNVVINDLIEDFGGVLYKRYRIYRRELENICY